MELSDEQYNQVLRYTDGEMNPTESKAFEAVLIHNPAISKEVEFYKEIRSNFESVDKKISNTNNDTGEKKTDTNEVLRMIKQARANWEDSHTTDSGQEQAMLLREVKNSQSQDLKRPLKEEPEVKRKYLSHWLAAAVLVGFVCIGVTFQYLRNKNAEQRIVYNKKQPSSKVALENKNTESQKKSSIPDTTSSEVNSSASDNTSFSSKVEDRKSIEKIKREKLFVKNFKPDNLPAQIPAPLEDPSAFYKNRSTAKAIKEYKNLLLDIEDAKSSNPETRGEDGEMELIAFYAHYYLAQSYMFASNMTSAIQELGNAIAKAPDRIWKNKVRWYMALAYLKTGKIRKAETLLKEVAENEQGNEYKQRAITLGNELKKY